MPVDRLEVRVSITKLLLALMIVIVPMSVIGLILTENSGTSINSAVANDYKTIAQMFSMDVSQFLTDRIADVKAIAADPTIVAAAANAHKSGATKNVSAATGGGTPATKADTGSAAMLATPASQLLRQRRDLDPRFLGIIVTDEDGNVVAASQKPSTSSYAQDELWQSTFNKGAGTGKIGNIIYDDFTKSYYMNVSMPITGTASNAAIGVVNAAVNVTPLLARFQAPVGNGAHAFLVNDDGNIVSGPNADVFAHVKSQEFDAVRDALGTNKGRQDGWTMATLRNGSNIVAYAATGLKQHYDNLGWVVVVSQEERIASAPVRGLSHFAILMVILAVFMLTLLCVYYFLHRSQRFEDIEEVLPGRGGAQTRDEAGGHAAAASV